MIDEKPDLIKLRRYLEGGAHGLVVRAIESYVSKVLPDWEKRCKKYMKARGVAKDGEQDHIDLNDLPLEFKVKGLSKFYYNEVQQINHQPIWKGCCLCTNTMHPISVKWLHHFYQFSPYAKSH